MKPRTVLAAEKFSYEAGNLPSRASLPIIEEGEHTPNNKICMLLLADITYDSRVQKEIFTLRKAGFHIDLYCLAGSFEPEPDDSAVLGRINVYPNIKYFSRYFRDVFKEAESLLRGKFGDRVNIRLRRGSKLSTAATLLSSAMFVVKELGRTVVKNFRGGRSEESLIISDLRQVFRLCGSMIAHGFARDRFIWLQRLKLYDVALVLCYWKQFIEQAGAAGYDFYHAHDLYMLYPAFRLARKHCGRLIFDAHEIMTVKAKTRNVLFWKAVEKALIKKCNAVITTTEMRGEYLRKRYGLRSANMVRNCPFYSNHPKTNLIHARLELPADKKIILYLGGVQEGRGLANLIRAMHDVRSHAVAVLMGPGKRYRDTIRQLIASEGLIERVHLTDPVEPKDIVRYATSADIGVQLLQNINFNHYSSLSTKLFQYMMAGLPIVCSDLPEMGRMVNEHDCGKTVDPEDVGSISTALNTLLEDDSLRDLCGRNARAASRNCSWEHEEGRLLSVYGAIRIDGDMPEQELRPVE